MRRADDIVEAARGYLGTPWLHQGRTRLGVDCAGLVIVVARDLELSNYDTIDYQRRTTGQEFLRHFQANMRRLPIQDARPGDVMLFRDKQYPCHSTILGEKDGCTTIIHAHALRRKVVEDYLHQGDWQQRRVAAFRFHGIEED